MLFKFNKLVKVLLNEAVDLTTLTPEQQEYIKEVYDILQGPSEIGREFQESGYKVEQFDELLYHRVKGQMMKNATPEQVAITLSRICFVLNKDKEVFSQSDIKPENLPAIVSIDTLKNYAFVASGDNFTKSLVRVAELAYDRVKSRLNRESGIVSSSTEPDDSIVVFENDKYKVYQVTSKAGMLKHGRFTEWCLTYDDRDASQRTPEEQWAFQNGTQRTDNMWDATCHATSIPYAEYTHFVIKDKYYIDNLQDAADAGLITYPTAYLDEASRAKSILKPDELKSRLLSYHNTDAARKKIKNARIVVSIANKTQVPKEGNEEKYAALAKIAGVKNADKIMLGKL